MKEYKINVDLVRQGLISLKDYEELPPGFKVRNNLNLKKALRIVKIDHRMDNRFADVTVREVETIKPEVKMAKRYKLEIQYPITRADAKHINDENMSLCWLYEHDCTEIDSDNVKVGGIPESWLTPIENKILTAEEYANDQYSPETKHFERHQIELAFNEGERNQRLKKDLEVKRLVEIVENMKDEYFKVMHGGASSYMLFNELNKALEKLKPIEEI